VFVDADSLEKVSIPDWLRRALAPWVVESPG
jgi:hypothetical protein